MTDAKKSAPPAEAASLPAPAPAVFSRHASPSPVITAALLIAFLTAIVRVASVGKELIIAGRFGTSEELDAYLIAILLPVAIVSVLAGSLSAAFIPIYVETRENEGQVAARRLFGSIISWSLPLLIALAALVVVTAPWYLPVLGSGFSPEKLRFTFRLVCLDSVFIVIGGISGAYTAALNAERKFAVTSAAPLATPIITIAFLWWAPGWRTVALIVGLLAGGLAELLILGLALKRLQFSLLPHWPQVHRKIRRFTGQFLPVISGSILHSGNSIVDQAMAAMLATGSVAALNYGNRIAQFPLGLASAALGTALMPHLSSMAASRNWPELYRSVRRYIFLSFALTLPLTAGLIIFSTPIVSLLFHRGAFVAEDVRLVSQIQALYALEIPSYLVSIIVARLISSLQQNRLLLFGTIINLFTNLCLNYLFMRWWGLPGIALSTSCVNLCSTIIWYLVIMGRLRKLMNTAP
ncbi:MAG TPA: lipid II flippase MurJ [Pyrinomonadaceae bacterium]|nr:lipid II flippase MurJ [Pyrinomonadaceae bacterium]